MIMIALYGSPNPLSTMPTTISTPPATDSPTINPITNGVAAV